MIRGPWTVIREGGRLEIMKAPIFIWGTFFLDDFCVGNIGNLGTIGAIGKVALLMQRRIYMGNVGRRGRTDFGFGIWDFGKVCR